MPTVKKLVVEGAGEAAPALVPTKKSGRTRGRSSGGGSSHPSSSDLGLGGGGGLIYRGEEAMGRVPWSEDEDQTLRNAIHQVGRNWMEISRLWFARSRSDKECRDRWNSTLRNRMIKGTWVKEEDQTIIRCLDAGMKKLSDIATFLPGRSGKQCRERYCNHLDPGVNKGQWIPEEDRTLILLQKQYGNRWSEIAKHMPGRSENNIKNRWNSAYFRRVYLSGESRASVFEQAQSQMHTTASPFEQSQSQIHTTTSPYGPNPTADSPHTSNASNTRKPTPVYPSTASSRFSRADSPTDGFSSSHRGFFSSQGSCSPLFQSLSSSIPPFGGPIPEYMDPFQTAIQESVMEDVPGRPQRDAPPPYSGRVIGASAVVPLDPAYECAEAMMPKLQIPMAEEIAPPDPSPASPDCETPPQFMLNLEFEKLAGRKLSEPEMHLMMLAFKEGLKYADAGFHSSSASEGESGSGRVLQTVLGDSRSAPGNAHGAEGGPSSHSVDRLPFYDDLFPPSSTLFEEDLSQSFRSLSIEATGDRSLAAPRITITSRTPAEGGSTTAGASTSSVPFPSSPSSSLSLSPGRSVALDGSPKRGPFPGLAGPPSQLPALRSPTRLPLGSRPAHPLGDRTLSSANPMSFAASGSSSSGCTLSSLPSSSPPPPVPATRSPPMTPASQLLQAISDSFRRGMTASGECLGSSGTNGHASSNV